MPPPLASIWRYFTKKQNNTANCKKCFKDIKHSGNTTNLYKHMRVHGIEVPTRTKNKKSDKTESL